MKSGFVTAILAASAVSVSHDGVWTGHDWSDTVNGIKDSDGDLSALNDLMAQRLNSTNTYEGGDIQSVYLD